MNLQSRTATVDARVRITQAPRRQEHASRVPSTRPPKTAPMRFWRALPLEVADIICGEGTVDDLPIHSHASLRIMLPASRFAVVDGRGSAVVVGPGQIHIAAPQELSGARSIDGTPCAMRVILVAPKVLPRAGEPATRLSPATTRTKSVVIDGLGCYAELWALVDDMRGPLVAVECATRLHECLSRLLAQQASPPAHVATLRSERHTAGVDRVCDHLRTHVAERLSLDELASIAGLSKFYLLRAFRHSYGVTPHAYQMQLRLGLAWRLIGSGCPLSRATYDAGFADQSHLTRRFAAVFGLTPARYARQLANKPGATPNDAFRTAAASLSAA
jgi:AraC-like DNA-binding protein